MTRRTQIMDYKKIETASDLERVVQDKRTNKRATKKKAKRRNRHYNRTLLKHLSEGLNRDIQ